MTDHLPQRPSRRPSQDGFAWKSGLLGVSLGAALLGWGLLARQGAAENAAASSARAASLPVQPIVMRVPALAYAQSDGTEALLVIPSLAATQPAAAGIGLPPLPQRPVFQQPVTRTRSS